MIELSKHHSRGILHWLGQQKWPHRVLALVRAYPIANWILKNFPITRKLSESLTYRITSLDLFALEGELWRNACYLPAIEGRDIRTFLDLGANVGWFPIWLAHSTGKKNLQGLLVEADSGCLPYTNWHLENNALFLSECHLVHGAVGLPFGQKETSFNRYPSATQSSTLPHTGNHPIPLKGKVEIVTVQAVRVAEEWPELFPNSPVIDLLKLDIEGMEFSFLKNEISFIQGHVKRIVMEWHKWHVTLPEISGFLIKAGFSQAIVLDEDELVGTVIFDNLNLPI